MLFSGWSNGEFASDLWIGSIVFGAIYTDFLALFFLGVWVIFSSWNCSNERDWAHRDQESMHGCKFCTFLRTLLATLSFSLSVSKNNVIFESVSAERLNAALQNKQSATLASIGSPPSLSPPTTRRRISKWLPLPLVCCCSLDGLSFLASNLV